MLAMAGSKHIERADVESLLTRASDVIDRERDRFWRRQRELLGPAASLRASESLMLHMRSIRPDWPTAAERDADLAHHVAWTTSLDRVARALAGR